MYIILLGSWKDYSIFRLHIFADWSLYYHIIMPRVTVLLERAVVEGLLLLAIQEQNFRSMHVECHKSSIITTEMCYVSEVGKLLNALPTYFKTLTTLLAQHTYVCDYYN